jgi:isopentenyldiphosphate isomerase
MDRDEFYAEQIVVAQNGGHPTRAVDIVSIFLFNLEGEMLIQKRSFDKAHNAGLLDKSIGGHMRLGDTADYTVMVETVQELQTPSIVLKDDEDFQKTFALLHEHLSTVAIIKHMQTELYSFTRIIKEKPIEIISRAHVYFGAYNGRVRPVDREAKGILWYSLSEMDKEMEVSPQTFTSDLHVLLKALRGDMEAFVGLIKEK